MADLDWTDSQWQQVQTTVNEAFSKASVASFLPCLGPLPGSAETVRNDRLVQAGNRINLNTAAPGANLDFINLRVDVSLSREQIADETLSNAILAFRRAANILAQSEDEIVFGGYGTHNRQPPPNDPNHISHFVANSNTVTEKRGLADPRQRLDSFEVVIPTGGNIGVGVINAVVDAITTLETSSHPEPFACILGNNLYTAVYAPTENLQLAAETIKGLLKGGALLRSGRMDPNAGIVVSLAANAIDIVVATPPTVEFLQREQNATFLFRVYERFVLRIRDRDITNSAVEGFVLLPAVQAALNAGDAAEAVAVATAVAAAGRPVPRVA